jgi:hypothetical protein
MTGRVSIPAISREVEFLAQHTDEADEIWEGNVEADANVLQLLNEIKPHRAIEWVISNRF